MTSAPAALLLGLALLGTGCAMRVTGVVRDAATGAPIAGALLSADDGRGRVGASDHGGRYAVKTDWEPTTLVVTAPGYRSTTVPVPGDERYPVVDVELQRARPLPRPR